MLGLRSQSLSAHLDPQRNEESCHVLLNSWNLPWPYHPPLCLALVVCAEHELSIEHSQNVFYLKKHKTVNLHVCILVTFSTRVFESDSKTMIWNQATKVPSKCEPPKDRPFFCCIGTASSYEKNQLSNHPYHSSEILQNLLLHLS